MISGLRETDQSLLWDATFNQVLAATSTQFVKPRRLERLLNVHFVVHDVGNELSLGHGLVRSAHDAESDVDGTPLHESRNNRMKGPLMGSKNARAPGFQRESGRAILEKDAVITYRDS